MTENILKNPNRNLNKTVEKYVPEHKRRGISPTQIPNSVGNEDQKWIQEELLSNYKIDEPILNKEVSLPLDEKDVKQDLGLSSVIIGEFVLLYEGSVVLTGYIEEIKDAISYLSINNDISIEDFVVFKRCNVKIGIFVE